MARAKHWLIPLLFVAWPAAAHDWTFEEVQGHADAISDTFYLAEGGTTIWLPTDPADLFGCIKVQKADNTSGPVRAEVDGALPVGGWTAVVLTMSGDTAEICSTGWEYIVTGWPDYGEHGQHRTVVLGHPSRGATLEAQCSYAVHDSDRGALIRVTFYLNRCNGTVSLPTPETIGWEAGGYRGGWRVEIMTVDLSEPWALLVIAPGTSIDRKPHLWLRNDREKLVLDFDGNEWFVVSHYIPGPFGDTP